MGKHEPAIHPRNTRAGGFSLVEMMVVVAIIAILGTVAYPSYRDHMRRSNRSEGHAMLLDGAARQERFFTENNTYSGGIGGTSEHGYYQLSSTVTGGGAGYTMEVQAQGGQLDDTQCRRMQYTSAGQKRAFDVGNNDTTGTCWP